MQTAAKLVLEPIFEADFEDNAYGYRPARGALDEIAGAREQHTPALIPLGKNALAGGSLTSVGRRPPSVSLPPAPFSS